MQNAMKKDCQLFKKLNIFLICFHVAIAHNVLCKVKFLIVSEFLDSADN